jgi:hypothetical protein
MGIAVRQSRTMENTMAQETTLGNPIPVGVISSGADDAQLALPAHEELGGVAWPEFWAADTLWLAPLKIGLATSLAATAFAFNPFFALNVGGFDKIAP